MILGTGIDIIEVERIEASYEKFGERFLNSGFEVTVHPSDFSAERHELFLYALSAYWPNETLEIIPFTVRE